MVTIKRINKSEYWPTHYVVYNGLNIEKIVKTRSEAEELKRELENK